MFEYTIEQIAQISSSVLYSKAAHTIVKNIHFDSRSFVQTPHTLFLAIPGKNHNGHNFIKDLYAQGCRIFWVEKGQEYPRYDNAHYIESTNVLRAFQQVCAYHRTLFSIPVIGITGSNGKTIVKEWLYHILSAQYSVVRSPRSYNSQIGVPLSLRLISKSHEIAIIEAGISEPNEMAHLHTMIQPNIGIFTNIGDAHNQNFESFEQKVSEKMKLFSSVSSLIYCADYTLIHTHAQKLECEKYAWSTTGNGNIQVNMQHTDSNTTIISIHQNGNKDLYAVPFIDSASLENCVHCIIAARILNAENSLRIQIQNLPQIEMRLEQKKGIHNCTIINDSYNSDLQSIRIALEFLSQQKQHSKKTLILSDVEQTGISNAELYKEISELISAHEISRFIGIGTEISKYADYIETERIFFANTHDFLDQINSIHFENELILLKGARNFTFEKIAQRLEFQIHQTVLEINLNAIIDNLNYFRSYLNPHTKIMVMVKAFSYGSGTFEIANVLQNQKVDYLAVAFVDEGIELRNAGITIPIVVMNPEISTIELAYIHNLEIEVYNFAILHEVFRCCTLYPDTQFNIHVKIDTGMVRYGFREQEISKLIQEIQHVPQCTISSVFSHLVGSDESRFDDFTREQIALFETCSSQITSSCNYPITRHILNSAGIERFSEFQYNMVRLGIGLYGISAINQEKTRHVSTLKTHISHIRTIKSGTSVGYSRVGNVTRNSRIAVLPIGYADGLRRKLSNGIGTVLVQNREVPIIGNICMDATMIDITDVDAQIGDEVIVFGENHPITTMAKKLETIPYEVITGISQRVKRIYFLE